MLHCCRDVMLAASSSVCTSVTTARHCIIAQTILWLYTAEVIVTRNENLAWFISLSASTVSDFTARSGSQSWKNVDRQCAVTFYWWSQIQFELTITHICMLYLLTYYSDRWLLWQTQQLWPASAWLERRWCWQADYSPSLWCAEL